MKIVTKVGNLLDVTEGHLIQGCNAQGVMGSGVAAAVRNKYPLAYQDYRDIYEDEGLELGTAYPYMPSTKLVIWNAITQEYYGRSGRNCSYDAIETCFADINAAILSFDEVTKEIHIPLLGAGLGGGNWEIIREIIEQTCTVPVTLWILPT
jgi:O-acetyl-ADP-ribose deacetylase (regulator of RNase III)